MRSLDSALLGAWLAVSLAQLGCIPKATRPDDAEPVSTLSIDSEPLVDAEFAFQYELAVAATMAEQSAAVRQVMASDLSHEEGERFPYGSGAPHSDEELAERVREVLRKAVLSAKWYKDTSVPPETLFAAKPMLRTDIVQVRAQYASVDVSDVEAKSALGVRLYVCPNRGSALAVFWLMRGGRIGSMAFASPMPDDTAEAIAQHAARYVESVEQADLRPGDDRYRILAGEENPGELAYYYEPHHLGLPESDPSRLSYELRPRMGMIRGNVVVDATAWHYTKGISGRGGSPEAVSRRGFSDLLSLLRSLDNGLLKEAGGGG